MVATEEGELEPYLDDWDSLAAACGRPFCQPAWMLAWWQEAKEGDARLRVVLVLDGERLIGVAPFFAQVGLGLAELRLLAAGFCHRIGPLATPGEEPAVAQHVAAALAAMRPVPASVVFEGTDAGDGWPERIAAAWPGRAPRLRTDATMEAPMAELEADYEAWLRRRSRNFRKAARRRAHRLEEAGVQDRVALDGTRIATLLRLHRARWQDRGGSDVGEGAKRVVERAARGLAGTGRLQIASLEGPDGPIAAELVVSTGKAAAFWTGGFDPRWARSAPGTQAILLALRWAAEQGIEVADLGGGAHDYKLKMSDRDEPIVWRTVFPRGPRYPLIRARLAPKHLRHWLRGRKLVRRVLTSLRDRGSTVSDAA